MTIRSFVELVGCGRFFMVVFYYDKIRPFLALDGQVIFSVMADQQHYEQRTSESFDYALHCV